MDDFTPLPQGKNAPLNEKLRERYIAGECSLTERVAVERWIKFNGEYGAALQAMRLDGEFESTLAGEPSAEGLLLSSEITKDCKSDLLKRDSVFTPQHTRSLSRKLIGSRNWFYMAASTFAIMAVLIVAYITLDNDKLSESISPVLLYSTGVGEVARVDLADGSRVTLGPQTTLYVANDFNRSTRSVRLTGEAQFQVNNVTGEPFIINAGTTLTKVIGTTFTVRRYLEDTVTTVAVLSGKVSVGANISSANNSVSLPPSVVLSAGMVGYVGDSYASGSIVKDVHAYASWTNGSFVFRDTPIPEVLTTLGRWYGIKFELSDSSLLQHHLNDRFEFVSMERVIKAVEVLLDVTAVVDNERRVVRLNPRVPAIRADSGR